MTSTQLTELFTEEDIIKRKLLFDADGMGDDRRINLMMKTFFQWMSAAPGQDRDLNLQRLFIMLNDAELAMKKSCAIREMNNREFANYGKITEQLDAQLNQSRDEIIAVKSELVKAKHTQRNRVEYEQIAAKIDTFQTRGEAEAKLQLIKSEIADLEARKVAILKKLDERRDQFKELINLAQSINATLEEDEREEGPMEEGPVALGQSTNDVITLDRSDDEDSDNDN